jgi:uroporphyrinogen decarboxylase
MEPYERIVKCVKHQRPDRPAIDYVATPEAHANLKRHLGIDDDEKLLQRLGVDIRHIGPRYVGPKELKGECGIGSGGKDFMGITWKPIVNKFGTYYEIDVSPLARMTTVREIEEYSWPKVDWFDFSHLKGEIARINKDHRYAIIYFVGGAFESPWYMRGLERFLTDLVECPDIAEAISSRITRFYKERAMRAIEASGGQIDIVISGGDIGTQRGMMLSPNLWRQHIKPYSTQLIRTFKDMGLITYYHSCGSLFPVIGDFIEMGLDILDPIQPKAADMEPEKLKKHFGKKLTFHGGVDEQELLPHGKPSDVRKEVERLVQILGSDGAYVVCPAHALQPDTPMENIMAIYDTAQNLRM